MFIETCPTCSRPAELVKREGNFSLVNAAGRTFWPQRVYKHVTPDGVGNVIVTIRCRENLAVKFTHVPLLITSPSS